MANDALLNNGKESNNMLIGDINNDNIVDVFDLSLLVAAWGANDSSADLNDDGIVDAFDLSILASNWQKTNDDLPTIPQDLVAVAGNAEVLLSWGASSSADTYSVKRSTFSGGPYSLVVTGITSTSHTDIDLTNGITYYYVVSASSSVGESANSLEVDAVPHSTALFPYVGLYPSDSLYPIG